MANVSVIVGLGFGDEGKGGIVDLLALKDSTVVRFNGGAQAGHNVTTEDGRHHTFSQFGSGTFNGARTHLSRFMLVNPIAFLSEGKNLQTRGGVSNAFDLVTVDGTALVTNPYHVIANRLREMSRSNGRHGSCGMGIGETVADHESNGDKVLFVRDLMWPDVVREKLALCRDRYRRELAFLRLPNQDSIRVQVEQSMLLDEGLIEYCVHEYTNFARLVRIVDGGHLGDVLAKDGTVLFEGAQGVLLDEDHGFFPHVTRSKTTFVNADTLLKESGFKGEAQRIGVTRRYMTRHGAGPFPTEDPNMRYNDNNVYGTWQEGFRFGNLDFVLLRYAIAACGWIDGFAVTCVDQGKEASFKICTHYSNTPKDSLFVDNGPTGVEKVLRPSGLKQQRGLGQALSSVTPEYITLASRNSSLPDRLDEIENLFRFHFGKPVLIQSFGRTASDKAAC